MTEAGLCAFIHTEQCASAAPSRGAFERLGVGSAALAAKAAVRDLVVAPGASGVRWDDVVRRPPPRAAAPRVGMHLGMDPGMGSPVGPPIGQGGRSEKRRRSRPGAELPRGRRSRRWSHRGLAEQPRGSAKPPNGSAEPPLTSGATSEIAKGVAKPPVGPAEPSRGSADPPRGSADPPRGVAGAAHGVAAAADGVGGAAWGIGEVARRAGGGSRPMGRQIRLRGRWSRSWGRRSHPWSPWGLSAEPREVGSSALCFCAHVHMFRRARLSAACCRSVFPSTAVPLSGAITLAVPRLLRLACARVSSIVFPHPFSRRLGHPLWRVSRVLHARPFGRDRSVACAHMAGTHARQRGVVERSALVTLGRCGPPWRSRTKTRPPLH